MKKLTAERCKRQIEEWQRMMSVSDVAVMVELNLQAYLIALPILEQQERGEPAWIEWSGKGKPAEANPKMIEVKFRDGDTATEIASLWRWSHHENDSDIIAYRVVEQERERGE